MADSLTREQRAMLEGFGRSAAEMLGKKTAPSLKVARGYIAEAGDHTYDVLMPDGAVLEEVPCLVSALGGTAGDEVRVEWVQGRALVTGVVATADNARYVSLVPFLEDGFVPYTEDESENNFPRLVRRGTVAMATGAVKTTSNIATSSDAVVFATLPAEWRPAARFIAPMQGSSMNRWLMEVLPSGDMTMARYGTTAYGTVTSSNWLVFTATYLLA